MPSASMHSTFELAARVEKEIYHHLSACYPIAIAADLLIGAGSLSERRYFGAGTKYALMSNRLLGGVLSAFIIISISDLFRSDWSNADDHDCHPGVVLGKIGPFERCMSEYDHACPVRKYHWPEYRNLCPWQIEFVLTNANCRIDLRSIVSCLNKPPRNIVE